MKLSEQEKIRREKLAKLIKLGVNPYPANLYPVDHLSEEIKTKFSEKKKVVIAGRIMSRRIQGNASFAEILDSKGKIQVYFNRDEICKGENKEKYNIIYKKLLDIGDIIGIEGELFTTKVGEKTVLVKDFTLLNKSLRPLPLPKEDADGKTYDEFNDTEQRYRQRYVDLIVNPHVKETFIKRTKIINLIRDFLNSKEYLEVEGVEEKDLYLFHYNRKKLEEKGYKAIWLNYFLKEWSNHKNAVFSKEHGLRWRPENFDREAIGTYLPYFQLDGDLTQVNQLLKYIKFGFGQCMDHVCYDLRDGLLSRDEAIKLVKKYDGKCSEVYIEKFCSYIGISQKEFWRVTEKFRGPMWKKDQKGNWYNTFIDILKQQ